jgi:hypothetical protein
MTSRARQAGLALTIGASLVAFTACGIHQGAGNDFAPASVDAVPAAEHLGRLADLPLRFDDKRWHIDLRPGRSEIAAVREAHLLRDVMNSRNDTVFVIYDDNVVQSINARDFTLNWTNRLDHRTRFAPVMTTRSVFFIDGNGEYQQLARDSGRLQRAGSFGTNYFPSAQMAANDTHVVIPTTNQNAVKGWADTDQSGSIGAPQSWFFPNASTAEEGRFEMVQLQPVADSGAIYFIANNNILYGISAKDGARNFRKELGHGAVIKTPPVLHDGIIYAGSDTALFAVSVSGDILWSLTTDGAVDGKIYAMDDQVFFNTVRYDFDDQHGGKYRNLSHTLTTQVAPGMSVKRSPLAFQSVTFTRKRPGVFDAEADQNPGDPEPVKKDGDKPVLDTEVIRGPRSVKWTTPSLGQEVLLKTKSQIFVRMLDRTVPYSAAEVANLRQKGRVVNDAELEVTKRALIQVLDANTGEVMWNGGEPASYDVTGYDFILGSMDASDRSIYIVTKDGHLFKGFGK